MRTRAKATPESQTQLTFAPAGRSSRAAASQARRKMVVRLLTPVRLVVSLKNAPRLKMMMTTMINCGLDRHLFITVIFLSSVVLAEIKILKDLLTDISSILTDDLPGNCGIMARWIPAEDVQYLCHSNAFKYEMKNSTSWRALPFNVRRSFPILRRAKL